MNRRQLLLLGLSTVPLGMLTGCGSCGFMENYGQEAGAATCKTIVLPLYRNNKETPVKVYYAEGVLVFLSPDFSLVQKFHKDYKYTIQPNAPLSQEPFIGLPDSILKRGYLKFGVEPYEDLLFSANSTETQVSLKPLDIGWAKNELNADEKALLEKVMARYQTALHDGVSSDSPITSMNMDALFWTGHQMGIDPENRVPALRKLDDPAYVLRVLSNSSIAEIYAPTTYPTGFFEGVKKISYRPSEETLHEGTPIAPPKSYAWENRPSPIKIDEQGNVMFNRKILKQLIVPSAFNKTDVYHS